MKTQWVLIGNNPPRSHSICDSAPEVLGQHPHLVSRSGTLGPVTTMDVDQICLGQQLCGAVDGTRIIIGGTNNTIFFGIPDLNAILVIAFAQDIFRN